MSFFDHFSLGGLDSSTVFTVVRERGKYGDSHYNTGRHVFGAKHHRCFLLCMDF